MYIYTCAVHVFPYYGNMCTAHVYMYISYIIRVYTYVYATERHDICHVYAFICKYVYRYIQAISIQGVYVYVCMCMCVDTVLQLVDTVHVYVYASIVCRRCAYR